MSRCRGCDAPLSSAFLDLGRTPLANAYLRPEDVERGEPTFPLRVAYCDACHLVQLLDVVPPEQLFSRYAYFSSYSSSFLDHARAMAGDLTSAYELGPDSRVLEIASNDGYLLRNFQERGVRVLGVEPASNVAAVARERGVPTLDLFFGPEAVSEIEKALGPADLIVGNNVLAHVPQIVDFLSAVRRCLADAGAAVFEFPALGELLDRVAFDTIYHEHVFYLSVSAVVGLTRRAGLEVFDLSKQAVHGGSYRVHVQHPGRRPIAEPVARVLAEEAGAGLTSAERFARFEERVGLARARLVETLGDLARSGKKLAAYGAPAKGNTLLNTCGITHETLAFTVDRSPHKQGRLLPGSHIPILAPEELLARMPDVALILPWNLADEIVAQQTEYLARGGAFLLPLPEPRVLTRQP